MRYLLDTHAFIWWNTDAPELPARVREILANPENIILLSLASVWEMQIKLQVGKLTLPAPLAEIIEKQQHENQIELLPIILSHILALEHLPAHHRDPFDRLLIAQAQVEDIPLLSNDPILARYPVRVIW